MFSWKLLKQIAIFSGFIFIPLRQLLITWFSLRFSDILALRKEVEACCLFCKGKLHCESFCQITWQELTHSLLIVKGKVGPDWFDSQLTVYFLSIINTHHARWVFDVSHLHNMYLFCGYLTEFSHLWGVCAAHLNIFSFPLLWSDKGAYPWECFHFCFVCWLPYTVHQGHLFTRHRHLLMQHRGVFAALVTLSGQKRDLAFPDSYRYRRTHSTQTGVEKADVTSEAHLSAKMLQKCQKLQGAVTRCREILSHIWLQIANC